MMLYGNITDCSSPSPSVNPFSKQHGAPSDTERHVGDLGNFKTDAQGNAQGSIKDEHIKLYGKESVVGVSPTPLCMNGRDGFWADLSSSISVPLLSIPVLMTLVRAVMSRARSQGIRADDLLAVSLASLSRYSGRKSGYPRERGKGFKRLRPLL